MIDQQVCMLEVLDTAGQEEYATLRDQWIRGGEGFLLVYSITSRKSFRGIQEICSLVQSVKASGHFNPPTRASAPPSQKGGQPTSTGPVPVMLVGNKLDKHHEREVSHKEGEALATELGYGCVEASAKNVVDVEKAFFYVVRQFRRQRLVPLGQSNSTKGSGGGSNPGGNIRYDASHKHKNRRSTKCVIFIMNDERSILIHGISKRPPYLSR